MPNVAPLNREELAEFEPVFKLVEQVMGFVPRSMLTMGRRPDILRGFAALMGAVLAGGTVDGSLKQLVAMVSSVTSGCRYCQAHTAGNASKMSVPNEKIQDLLKFDTSEHFTGAERAALALAFAAGSVPNRSSKEHFVELRKHFNEKQIVHIVSVIALFGFLNRWNETMATALEEHPKAFGEKVLAKNGWEAGKHAPEGVGR